MVKNVIKLNRNCLKKKNHIFPRVMHVCDKSLQIRKSNGCRLMLTTTLISHSSSNNADRMKISLQKCTKNRPIQEKKQRQLKPTREKVKNKKSITWPASLRMKNKQIQSGKEPEKRKKSFLKVKRYDIPTCSANYSCNRQENRFFFKKINIPSLFPWK